MKSIFVLLLSVLAFSGCKKKTGCAQFGAENYDPDAVINDDSCIEVRDKFLGTFAVSSDCIADDYIRTISSTSDNYIVVINNLADTLGSVEAWVSGLNITIEPQTVHGNITIEGAGVYVEENAISISYRVRDSRSGTEVIHDCMEWCSKL